MVEKSISSVSNNEINQSKAVHDIERNSLQGTSDQELWSMFKKGHTGAFRSIYLNYYKELHRFGYKLCANSDLVKDCIQDLFLELRNSKNLSDTNSIRFYLLKALKFKINLAIKQQSSFTAFNAASDEYDNFTIELSDEVKHIHFQLEDDQKKQIQHLLSSLTKNQREALYYFYFENLSYKEVAELMGLRHVRSARNLIYKALESIRVYLKLLSGLLFCFIPW